MATTENPGPKGELVLVDYFHESSSGHFDKSNRAVLLPGNGTMVTLDVFADSCNHFKGPREESRELWEIDREALIGLINQHGKRVG
ncbi:hypothetical protein OYT13_11795 [Pandoraea sp. XJJ-1]|uniref:Uncharacterized protein n=3 Tax=Pandoraea TaxID=93217 RepID=A0A5E5PBU6_9BURK|nr:MULTISPECIES: hypothetical protein [Pandoraea]MBN9094635.1 hypothetical protein [Pandoraea pnomenusa]OXS88479.1 hypothetical protein B7H01_22285 [Pandoraea apista]RRJ28820.1 hypothetical protein EIB05_17820 [Pandoraea apista]RRJ73748.1 hypothetical protein EIL82_18850 [Pandoraea apista]RSD07649.1 hypothetical protein EJB12_17780 [Pandoraea apista]